MSKTVRFNQQPAIPMATQPEPRTRDALGEKLRAATIAGLSIFILLIALGFGVIYLFFTPSVESLGTFSMISLIVSILATSALSLRWSLLVAARDWKVDDAERLRRWRLQDEDRKHAAQMADAIAQQHEDEEIIDYSWVPIIAFEILQRHFFGQSTTRHACTVDAKLCSQADWNLINQVFLSIGLKRGYKLTPGDTLEEAWATWAKRVKLADEDILVRKGPQLQWKPIEVE